MEEPEDSVKRRNQMFVSRAPGRNL